jgi:mono/diheme cytochrome c family protein
MLRTASLAGLAFALSACATAADIQPPATDAAQGRLLVERYCVGCHSVQPEGASPLASAPPFRWFKTLQPDTLQEVALHIGRGEHSSMPQIILTHGESTAIAAFIRAYANADPKTQKSMSLVACVGRTAPC